MKNKIKVKVLNISAFKSETENGIVKLTGYANTKNNADRYGDIPIGKNVYDLNEFKKNPVMLIDHINSVNHIAGSFTKLQEDEKGLFFEAEFSNSDAPIIKQAREIYKEGHAKALSMAGLFTYGDKENPNIITKAEIYEISLVAIPADPDALVEKVKQLEKNLKQRDVLINQKKELNKMTKEEILELLKTEHNIDVVAMQTQIVNLQEVNHELKGKKENTEKEKSLLQEQVKSIANSNNTEDMKLIQKELLEVKEKLNTAEKEKAFNSLIKEGKVFPSIKEKVLETFETSEKLLEFYKDIPAMISTKALGDEGKSTNISTEEKTLTEEFAERANIKTEKKEKK